MALEKTFLRFVVKLALESLAQRLDAKLKEYLGEVGDEDGGEGGVDGGAAEETSVHDTMATDLQEEIERLFKIDVQAMDSEIREMIQKLAADPTSRIRSVLEQLGAKLYGLGKDESGD